VGIDGGKTRDGSSTLSLLKCTVVFKDKADYIVTCHYMGHSQENPMMLTFIKVTEEGSELPVCLVNCDTVEMIITQEMEEGELDEY